MPPEKEGRFEFDHICIDEHTMSPTEQTVRSDTVSTNKHVTNRGKQVRDVSWYQRSALQAFPSWENPDMHKYTLRAPHHPGPMQGWNSEKRRVQPETPPIFTHLATLLYSVLKVLHLSLPFSFVFAPHSRFVFGDGCATETANHGFQRPCKAQNSDTEEIQNTRAHFCAAGHIGRRRCISDACQAFRTNTETWAIKAIRGGG